MAECSPLDQRVTGSILGWFFLRFVLESAGNGTEIKLYTRPLEVLKSHLQ